MARVVMAGLYTAALARGNLFACKKPCYASCMLKRSGLLCSLSLLSALAHAPLAHARNIEAGRLFVGGGIGPGLSIGSKLGTAPADFMFVGLSEWTLSRALSVVGDATIGVGGTTPLLGRAGLRLRAHDLGLAVSPYAQLQLAGGGLMKVMGSHLRFMGVRFGVGVEYFATANISFGLGIGAHLGSTLGQRPAFYGLVDGMLYVTFGLNAPIGSRARAPTLLPPPAATPVPTAAEDLRLPDKVPFPPQ